MYHLAAKFCRFLVGLALAALVTSSTARAQSVSITPMDWDFGDVFVGDFADTAIHAVSSHVSSPLIITDISFPSAPTEFTIEDILVSNASAQGSPFPIVLPPTGFVDIHVRFAPSSFGAISAEMVFESNDHIDPDIDLTFTGRGIRIPEPASASLMLLGIATVGCGGWRRKNNALFRACCVVLLVCLVLPTMANAQAFSIMPLEWDFGEVIVGESESRSIQIESTESTPAQIFSVTVTEDPQSVFAITDTDPDPIPLFLFFGETVDVTAEFTPSFVGQFAGTVEVHSNHHLFEYFEIALTGRGIAIPEPSSTILLALGLATLACAWWRRGHSRT